MRVAVWNCRGAGGPLTILQLKEIKLLHSPDLVFLCETKHQQRFMGSVIKRLNFWDSFSVNSEGKSGGLALLWTNNISVNVIQATSFFIAAHIMDQEARSDWYFVGVYASTDKLKRREQWNALELLFRGYAGKLLVAGDFNDITSNEEKWGGLLRSESTFIDFNSFIHDNQLVDIHFEGKPWTWEGNWEGQVIRERLDRVLVNHDWLQNFEKARCLHIQKEALDHSVLLLNTNPRAPKRRGRFIFDKRWAQSQDSQELVHKEWMKHHVGSAMFRLKMKLKSCRWAF